jgi:hypothetical protein
MATTGSSHRLSETDLSWLLYFFGPAKSGSFELSITARWHTTQALLKKFRKDGHNCGFDDEIPEDDVIH